MWLLICFNWWGKTRNWTKLFVTILTKSFQRCQKRISLRWLLHSVKKPLDEPSFRMHVTETARCWKGNPEVYLQANNNTVSWIIREARWTTDTFPDTKYELENQLVRIIVSEGHIGQISEEYLSTKSEKTVSVHRTSDNFKWTTSANKSEKEKKRKKNGQSGRSEVIWLGRGENANDGGEKREKIRKGKPQKRAACEEKRDPLHQWQTTTTTPPL